MTTGKKKDDGFFLDMPFEEAIERYVGVDPKEVHANVERSKKKKPPGRKKQPSGKSEGENVVSLRQRRIRKRNHGR